jgi:hypothetical protein
MSDKEIKTRKHTAAKMAETTKNWISSYDWSKINKYYNLFKLAY